MFNKSTRFYDLIYQYKNYKEEAERIKNIILKYNKKAGTILDTACGTHEHAKYLKEYFSIDGLDISTEFLKIANTKNPKGNYYHADFTEFKINDKYDVILCLFNSIGYCKTAENLKKTLGCFNNHLRKNGIIIIEPWLTPSQWQNGLTKNVSYEENNIKISRTDISKSKGPFISCLQFNYRVDIGNQTHYFKEIHEMGLFSKKIFNEAFRNINKKFHFLQDKFFRHGLYIGFSY